MSEPVPSPCSEGQLGLHVLSARMGESIVVTLPNGRWFVVDAFKGSPAGTDEGNAVVAFSNEFGLAAEDCIFALLTHLHEDHYSGLPGLLDWLQQEGSSARFMTHASYAPGAAQERVAAVLGLQETDRPADQWLRVGPRAAEIIGLCGRGYQHVVRGLTVCEEPGDRLRVIAVAPATEIVDSFHDGLALRSLLDEHREALDAGDSDAMREIRRREDRIINNMSIALWISYGRTGILLSADCEREAWTAMAAEPGREPVPGGTGDPLDDAIFLKSPHHGSSGTWCRPVERAYDGCGWAIATHHVRGSYRLPDLEGIERVLQCGVTLAVPDVSLLPSGAHDLVSSPVQPPIERIPVPLITPADAASARRLSRRLGAAIAASRNTELQWVSACFDHGGVPLRWSGGSRAAFLPGS